jgi:hypothetical protein
MMGLNVFCTTNKGFKKIPFIWVGAERAYQIKHNKDLRDVQRLANISNYES